jgi:hypothetical protein
MMHCTHALHTKTRDYLDQGFALNMANDLTEMLHNS